MTGGNRYDVWFVQHNTVYKEVPYNYVLDWIQQGRLKADDMVKSSDSDIWFRVDNQDLFRPYLPKFDEGKVEDVAEAMTPIELDFNWKKSHQDEDDDVDMIPLIDISLVLLIFFMMTATVASMSRIAVPGMVNGVEIDKSVRVLRIDVDKDADGHHYNVAYDNSDPETGDGDLKTEAELITHIKLRLAIFATPPKVRIAANADLPYEAVESLMKKLDELHRSQLIDSYHIEVNERTAPR